MKNKQDLEFYYQACNEVAKMFTKQYFCDKYITDLDEWWVAGDVGGVLEVGDYYFNFEDILTAIKKNVSEKVLFDWYEWSLNQTEVGYPSLKVYSRLLKVKEKK